MHDCASLLAPLCGMTAISVLGSVRFVCSHMRAVHL